MHTSSRKISARQSLLLSLSARLDTMGTPLGIALFVCACGLSIISFFSLLLPRWQEKQEMSQEISTKHNEIKALEIEGQKLFDHIQAFEDPYYVEELAIERYKFKPIGREASIEQR